MFQHILLAADGSKHSIRATEKAIGLLRGNHEGCVTVVYVVDGATSKSDVLHIGNSNEIAAKRREKLKAIVSLLEEAAVSYELKILHGDPGETIVEFANDHDFDCLVIGSRGLNSLQSMVLGGVSHKVAKRANCPVMIVK